MILIDRSTDMAMVDIIPHGDNLSAVEFFEGLGFRRRHTLNPHQYKYETLPTYIGITAGSRTIVNTIQAPNNIYLSLKDNIIVL